MASIYISDLITTTAITTDDFMPLVKSSSLTTYRVDFGQVGAWMSSSVTASHALYAYTASTATTASYAYTASNAVTASYLLYQGFPNGTASYALTASLAETASYFDASGVIAGLTTYASSASWASHSVSASYVPGSGVDGAVTSASYAISASYSITASYAISASHAISSSNAGTASHALFAETTIYNPKSIYGPFTASANVSSPTVGWSQWDYEKKAIAFTLAANSDVIIEITNNAVIDELSTRYYYSAVIVRASGLDDPVVDPPATVSEFDDFKFLSLYDLDQNGRIDTTIKHCFAKTGLTTGTWIIYVLIYYTSTSVSPWGTSGVDQKTNLDTFLASDPESFRETSQVRMYKFPNSVTANVYATAAVTQAIL